MTKFLVLYLAPVAGMEEWMKKPEAERKTEEDKMKADWDMWMQKNKEKLSGPTAGTGKTKRVTSEGVVDTKNDVMMYSMIEAESHEEASQLFVGHPHFGIPGASIDIMLVNFLPGIEKVQE